MGVAKCCFCIAAYRTHAEPIRSALPSFSILDIHACSTRPQRISLLSNATWGYILGTAVPRLELICQPNGLKLSRSTPPSPVRSDLPCDAIIRVCERATSIRAASITLHGPVTRTRNAPASSELFAIRYTCRHRCHHQLLFPPQGPDIPFHPRRPTHTVSVFKHSIQLFY